MQTLLMGGVAKLAGWVLPVILGPLVYAASRKLLNVHYTLDALPPTVKRIVVMGVGLAATAALTALGVAVPAECLPSAAGDCLNALATTPVVQGVTAALVAMICHALKKSSPR